MHDSGAALATHRSAVVSNSELPARACFAIGFLIQPSTLIALLIGYGSILIWTGWARWGRRFVSFGAILLLIAGLSPLGNALILPLEDRFPRADLDAPPPPAGFIILGGAEDRLVGRARGAPAQNEA